MPETLIQHLNFSQVPGTDCILVPSSDRLSSIASLLPSCASLTFGQEEGVTGERNFQERNLLLHKPDEDVLLHLR